MDLTILEKAGLTSSEARVYLALLDLGNSTVSAITRKSGVASSKTYELLDKLISKGIITTHIENNKKWFTAVNPKRIKDYLDDKKKELDDIDLELKQLMPRLEARFDAKTGESNVEVFKGYKGVETVFYEMIRSLNKGDEFLVSGGGETPTGNEMTKLFFERIHKRRSEKGIVQRIIFSEARRKSLHNMTLFSHTSARYSPYGTPSTVNVYKDTTILLTMSPQPAAIRIKNKQITDSYRSYFEQMWKSAKK